MLFALALLFNYVALFIPDFYLPVIATRPLGQSQDFAFESLAFVSVGSLFGRSIPMLAASYIGSVQVYHAATLAAVVVLFSWTAIHNVAGLSSSVWCMVSFRARWSQRRSVLQEQR